MVKVNVTFNNLYYEYLFFKLGFGIYFYVPVKIWYEQSDWNFILQGCMPCLILR